MVSPATGRSNAAVGEAAIISGVMNANPLNDGEVQKENAAEREAAQGVEDVQALAVSGRSRLGG